MGACFISTTLDGSKSEADLRTTLRGLQDSARIECGEEYSGSWNMLSGLKVVRQTFASDDAAREWLEDNTEKWDNAVAVRFKDGAGERWMMGGWAAE